ncbi:DUF4401 domain-containing protein [Janthinobacterium sp. HLX7-2]|uniref:DUF4401 domain-containing protein n=1 Tax=Janthinobacterium sp. HLX7-2 TaxID=1259331 RepID=UPI003F2183E1
MRTLFAQLLFGRKKSSPGQVRHQTCHASLHLIDYYKAYVIRWRPSTALYAQHRVVEGQTCYVAAPPDPGLHRAGGHSLKHYFFIQQFAVSAIIAGLLLLGFSLFRDLDMNVAAALLALIVATMAVLLPITWLRTLLAVPACALVILAQLPHSVGWLHDHCLASGILFDAGLTALAIWLFLTYLQCAVFNKTGSQRTACVLAAISSGCTLCMLAGFCLWSGMVFLMSAIMDNTGWIGVLMFFASGNDANKIYVIPVRRMVVSVASSAYGKGDGQRRSEDLLKAILPAESR